MDRQRAFHEDMVSLTKSSTIPNLIYSIHVSLRHRYIYFATPKAACSTIIAFLIRNESPDLSLVPIDPGRYAELEQFHDRGFSPLLDPRRVYPFRPKLESPEWFRFCFVRNPYSRLVSAYRDKILGRRPQANSIRLQLGLPLNYQEAIGFEAFVEAVCAQPSTMMDPHWRIQHDHLCCNAINYDFIGRFEHLGRDLAVIADRLGFDMSLLESIDPHRTGDKERADDPFTPRLKALVRRTYAADFETFGYDD